MSQIILNRLILNRLQVIDPRYDIFDIFMWQLTFGLASDPMHPDIMDVRITKNADRRTFAVLAGEFDMYNHSWHAPTFADMYRAAIKAIQIIGV